MKSITNRLNEFIKDLGVNFISITAGAFTKARKKLSHTAFIELNKKTIVETMYEDNDYKKYKGYRLCAVDGCKLRLPNEPDIKEHFGVAEYKNAQKNFTGENAFSTCSVLFDILNDIAIDSVIYRSNANELDLARENHFPYLGSNDLVIFDRNYCSYLFMSSLIKQGCDFLIRCTSNSFSVAKQLFNEEVDSITTSIKVHSSSRKTAKEMKLDLQIKIRFVRVILDTGEVEVLATSLLDEELFPHSDFKQLYWNRWGIETFYDRIKNRLDLGHFTGKTALSVKQDFYATIYLSGLESLLIDDAQDVLDQKKSDNKYPQQVNKSVSFNTIKNYALDLLYKENDYDLLLEKLTVLFLSSPTCIRKNRPRPRETSLRRQVDYYRCRRKIVF